MGVRAAGLVAAQLARHSVIHKKLRPDRCPDSTQTPLNCNILCVTLTHLDAETQVWFRRNKNKATGEMSSKQAFIQHPKKWNTLNTSNALNTSTGTLSYHFWKKMILGKNMCLI